MNEECKCKKCTKTYERGEMYIAFGFGFLCGMGFLAIINLICWLVSIS